jgi:hypothetical protein
VVAPIIVLNHISLLQAKPTGTAARTEMLLVGTQRHRRFVVSPDRVIGIGEKVHVDATDSPGPKFDIAQARSPMSHWNLLIPQACNQRLADCASSALGEDAGFWRALPGAVTDRVDVGSDGQISGAGNL